VQVDPLKPTLKAPGTKRLKVEFDELLSSFAFNFNLRRYNEEEETPACPPDTTLEEAETMAHNGEACALVPQVKHESYQVFKFVGSAEEEKHAAIKGDVDGCSLTCKGAVANMVGRCSLTLSQPS